GPPRPARLALPPRRWYLLIMPDHLRYRRGRRSPRLVLLLAGLLYLTGMAAEPLVHPFASPTQDGGVVWVGETGTDEPDSPVPHGDAQCLLCKLTGPLLLTARGPVVAVSLVPTAGEFVLEGIGHAAPDHLAPLPRAPPLV